MKRSKRNQFTQFVQQRCIDSFCRRMVRSTVDYSMTGSRGPRKSQMLRRFRYGLGGRDVLGEVTTEVDHGLIILVFNPKLTRR
jgi:hypothetical protein